jgi:hypothetical protein
VNKKYVQTFGGKLENRDGNGMTVVNVNSRMYSKIYFGVLNIELNQIAGGSFSVVGLYVLCVQPVGCVYRPARGVCLKICYFVPHF